MEHGTNLFQIQKLLGLVESTLKRSSELVTSESMIWILMEVTKDYESLSLLFLNLSVSEEPNLNQNLECFTSIRKSIFKWKNVPTVISVDATLFR
jgi:hypothetical protein